MTYILSVQTPASLDEFQKVDDVVGPEAPTGLLARYVGTNDLGMAITTIWQSKADADRFAAERLHPAMLQVFGELPGDPPAAVAYEAVDDLAIANGIVTAPRWVRFLEAIGRTIPFRFR